MRNIASVLLCALLVLQVTSFMVKDLADSVSQIDHESQNPI